MGGESSVPAWLAELRAVRAGHEGKLAQMAADVLGSGAGFAGGLEGG